MAPLTRVSAAHGPCRTGNSRATLTAGPELDALVAEFVMGDHAETMWWRGKSSDWPGLPWYSRSMEESGKVIDHLQRKGFVITLINDPRPWTSCRIQRHGFKDRKVIWEAEHSEAPVAICLAALKCVGYGI